MATNALELTFYAYTGYSFSDEPASDSVIDQNSHWVMPERIYERDPVASLRLTRVNITNLQAQAFDYLKIRDTVTNERWYFFIAANRRLNEKVIEIGIVLDNFATVGLSNITFMGNIIRRSLSGSEALEYPLLAEPWAPRRPLKTRRRIIDLNVNKQARVPAHIGMSFEEEETTIVPEPGANVIHVPQSPLQLITVEDSLDFEVELPMLYPTIAEDTEHTINTPWGSISYTTPFERYYNFSGQALTSFLEKAKKSNSLDLVQQPFYLPRPNATQNITITELSNPNIKNIKALRHYTTITIRSLASNATQTYSDNNMRMEYSQSLTVVVVPDKNGGIYLLPTTLRDIDLNAYTYLDGVYSPFETVTFNAVGDTPAKYASDGTLLLNTALNDMFRQYINKVNALQYEGMQAKYFKDLGSVRGLVMPFFAEIVGGLTTTITEIDGYWQRSDARSSIPRITQTGTSIQTIPQIVQTNIMNTRADSYTSTQTSSTATPAITTTGSSRNTMPAITSTQRNYSFIVREPGTSQTMPAIDNYTPGYASTQTSSQTSNANTQTGNMTSRTPSVYQWGTGSTTSPSYRTTGETTNTTPAYVQTSAQDTFNEPQRTVANTTQEGSQRPVEEGVQIADAGAQYVFESQGAPISGVVPGVNPAGAMGVLKNILSKGFSNEVHSFMLGNINDYLNRWISIQNDMHNGKVANLFKNVTLVGNYTETNKVAGKYEILIASLQDDDARSFDMFLSHFGHAVDEYTNTLVKDVGGNYAYTMIGEDAILTNSVLASANSTITNQFRTGVRVWKTLIRPENY